MQILGRGNYNSLHVADKMSDRDESWLDVLWHE